MGSLVAFVIALYIGLLLVFLVVYPIIVRANGLSVRQYFSGVWPALQLGAFSYLCTKLFSEGAVNSPYRELYS